MKNATQSHLISQLSEKSKFIKLRIILRNLSFKFHTAYADTNM